MALRELFTPYVQLDSPFQIGWKHDTSDQSVPSDRIRDLVSAQIILGTEHAHLALREFAHDGRWQEALPQILSDATALLREALDLMRELELADDRHDNSYMVRASIADHPQNNDFREWTALIDLVRDAWLATAGKSPDEARSEVERWSVIPYPVFRRLVFFALAEGCRLFSPQEALEWLLSDHYWWLWSIETQRETVRLLNSLARRLSGEQSDALQLAILRGPPQGMFQSDADAAILQRVIDHEVWLRLAKYRATGASLIPEAATRLDSVTREYPTWQLEDDQRDEFPFWVGEVEGLKKFQATPKQRRELATWLREQPAADFWAQNDWRERCINDFPRAATALIEASRGRHWVADRWRTALQAWAEEKFVSRSWRWMSRVIASAPDHVLKDLEHPLSRWVQSIAKRLKGSEDTFFELIRRILRLYRCKALDADDDVIFNAINHPVGVVIEAALSWWYGQRLEDNQGLHSHIVAVFTEVCDSGLAIFRHARVILGTHLIALFRVDPTWTDQYLLPLFKWDRSYEEARAVWIGFLWSPRAYIPLMQALKTEFLATSRYYDNLRDCGGQYAGFLTFIALDQGDVFTVKELADATASLPRSGLARAAQTLVQALESAGDQRGEYWRNRIMPYLKHVWPKSREVLNRSIGTSFARLCLAAGDDFPQAIKELRHWLQSISDPDFIVHLLDEAKLSERFPSAALEFLSLIIADDTQFAPTELGNCLEAIRTAEPALAEDDRFRRLGQFLRQHSVN
jgi:hypothetical protein